MGYQLVSTPTPPRHKCSLLPILPPNPNSSLSFFASTMSRASGATTAGTALGKVKNEYTAILEDDARLTAISDAAFDAVDTDKSGCLSFDEYVVMVKQTTVQAGFEAPDKSELDAVWAATLKELDRNNDGKVDRKEFKVLMKQILAAMVEFQESM